MREEMDRKMGEDRHEDKVNAHSELMELFEPESGYKGCKTIIL